MIMSGQNQNPNSQYSKPIGSDGVDVLHDMNDHHAPLWDWIISNLPRAMDGSILDIGCGGGGFLKRLSDRYPYALFFGIDISDDALDVTAEVNYDLMEEGGLELLNASVSDIPFEEGSFDLVTAVETYFFWPDLKSDIEEAYRVTSAGGMFVIGSEMRVTVDDAEYIESSFRDYGARLVPDEVIVGHMESAGFDVKVETAPDSRWVMYIGVKRI